MSECSDELTGQLLLIPDTQGVLEFTITATDGQLSHQVTVQAVALNPDSQPADPADAFCPCNIDGVRRQLTANFDLNDLRVQRLSDAQGEVLLITPADTLGISMEVLVREFPERPFIDRACSISTNGGAAFFGGFQEVSENQLSQSEAQACAFQQTALLRTIR